MLDNSCSRSVAPINLGGKEGKETSHSLYLSGFRAERRMFYSPAGKVFTSRDAALKFLQKTSPATSVLQPRDFCQVQIDASDSSVVLTDQEEEDTITLSEDDLEDLAEPPKKKTKYEKMPASALSGRQEEILVGCYQEWPQLTGSVVTEIVKDTGLLAQVVTRWYGERTRNIIEQILCNDKSSGST